MKINYVHILAYHSISDCALDSLAVSVCDFERQMRWLSMREYTVLPMAKALEGFSERRIPKNTVVLTFDDGFADFFTNAAPILEKHKYPATLFIVAGKVDGLSSWRDGALHKPLLNWSALKELARRGYQIGSHGMFHKRLTDLTFKELKEELVNSKKLLESRLGVMVDAFSYPWGCCQERERNAVKNSGYSCAVTVKHIIGNSPRADLFQLERKTIFHRDSFKDFKCGIGHR